MKVVSAMGSCSLSYGGANHRYGGPARLVLMEVVQQVRQGMHMVHTHLLDMVILSGVLRVVISGPDGAHVSVPRGSIC
ncbi:hypothetical protein DCAR_0519434 [Daucus carota subsp. sativus]|uniref:Uncharacterized protein n=1 Tax=Daucus carota subsp. sativus TaxID=79200 RepID=A0A164XYQ6_DAUCS|nr:hypothetical protein DCAR_0519434 [Daucus carota subsp. sativus]